MQLKTKPVTQIEVLKNISIKGNIEEALTKARCEAYGGNDDTHTYFRLELGLSLADFAHIKTTISSGKYFDNKNTVVRITNKNGDILEFDFHNHKIVFNGEKINFDYTTPSDNAQAYENVLYNLYVGDHCRFISADVALEALRIVTPALDANVLLKSYEAKCNSSEI